MNNMYSTMTPSLRLLHHYDDRDNTKRTARGKFFFGALLKASSARAQQLIEAARMFRTKQLPLRDATGKGDHLATSDDVQDYAGPLLKKSIRTGATASWATAWSWPSSFSFFIPGTAAATALIAFPAQDGLAPP